MGLFNAGDGVEFTEAEVREIFQKMDGDGSGEIGKFTFYYLEYTEFLTGFMENMLFQNKKFLQYAYNKIDLDKSGEITVEDLEMIMKSYKLQVSRY